MNIEEIRELIRMMKDNQLGEIDIRGEAGKRIRLRSVNFAAPAAPPQGGYPMLAPAGPSRVEQVGQAPAGPPPPEEEPGEVIASPIVGIYYSAPSPDKPPFVQPGDAVEESTVVCIIEAMKVMNEIKAEKTGIVRKVFVENGQPIEYGQPLFLLEPAH